MIHLFYLWKYLNDNHSKGKYRGELEMKMVIKFLLGKLETLAVRSLSISANTTCSWLNHQPKIPNEIHKYKVR